MLDYMHDDLDDDDQQTPEDLEHLARSLAMDGSLGRLDALRVADVLREVATATTSPERALLAVVRVELLERSRVHVHDHRVGE